MISIAWERASEHTSNKVHFEIGDVTKQTFPDQSFDIIYSRDTILHIPNKEGLFALFKVYITTFYSGYRF
jgi:phosphoethanolamine N-methyltransferase